MNFKSEFKNCWYTPGVADRKFQEASLVKEQKAQQDNRFVKGRQIAYMIYDHFKINGTGEALLDFDHF